MTRLNSKLVFTIWFFSAVAVAKPVQKWDFDFSSRVQMRVTEKAFQFERCDFDICHPISKTLKRPLADDNKYNDIIDGVGQNREHQFIQDALINYKLAPEQYENIVFGIAIAPEKLEVHCNQLVAKFVDSIAKKKTKVKSDYIYHFEGHANDNCNTSDLGESVRTIDQVERETKDLVSLYERVLSKFDHEQ
jgi:hypothetical protein